jgi:hypothetical protein
MSTTSTANDLARPLRRSTRLNAAVPLTVMGVDSYRGPYREQVSTATVSCHGCRYESKHDVLTNSWVMLELPGKGKESQSVSARGLVKWVKRPDDTTGVYETAIELEDPGNIWGIDTPPQDWLTFCESQLRQPENGKSKPFALPKPEVPPKAAIPTKSGNGASIAPLMTVPSTAMRVSAPTPTGLLMGEFHQQMEKMLFDAAATAVREKATSTLDEVRHGLRDEARRALGEVASSQMALWIEQFIRQLNRASQDSARTLHAAWAKRLEADIAKAMERVEERGRELDTLAQSLSANALDRLQRGLESSRGEGVDRIVSRLKEQSAPVIDHAKETIADLGRQREELEAVIGQSIAHSTAKIEATCAGFDKQFEMLVRERLDGARDELQANIQSATASALGDFSRSAQEQETGAQGRLRQAFDSFESALAVLKQTAADTSRQFGADLSNHTRSHLESVSSAIAEVAKGIGKQQNA